MSGVLPQILAASFGALTIIFLLAVLKPIWRKRVVDVLAISLIVAVVHHNMTKSPPSVEPSEFAQTVRLEPLRNAAVQASGSIKSFDSFARGMMRYVSGPIKIAGQDAAFTYLDLMFRPEAYQNADIIYVKKKPVRRTIANRLTAINVVDPSVLDTFCATGLISPSLLQTRTVTALLEELEADLIKTAKPVDAIRSALTVADPQTLSRSLRMVPSPSGDPKDQWFLLEDLWGAAPQDAAHAGVPAESNIPGLDSELAKQMRDEWRNVRASWRSMDANAVSGELERLAAMLRSVAPSAYPDLDRLKLENWYFRSKGMTWIWLVYAAALVPLLMSVIYHWRGARLVGIGLFLIAFGLHTTSLGLRWHISGRIPNSNMFEAITAATWFGAAISFILEFATRRTPMRNLFFLGAAAAAMTASMCSAFMPITLNAEIGNIMPILHDVWLYIHTNMIITSYVLIAMAAVTALLYLRHRIGGGAADVAILGGAGSLLMRGSRHSFISSDRVTAGQVLDGATMVLMELSFVTLWTGLVMGAIWADHSWGRPWGWDPKEVFALNTFIVFLLLVHVRFKVRDKGLWTAILAVAGCGIMLFNWIVINFIITGLHSYA